MKVLACGDLSPAAQLPSPIYDRTGQQLLGAGESLGRARVRMLQDCGIKVVFVPDPGENVAAFFGERQNIPVEVGALEIGGHTTKPLLDDKGVLLLKEDAEITREFIDSFHRRGIRFLYVEQTEAERIESERQISGFRTALEADRRRQLEAQFGHLADTPVEFSPEELVVNAAEVEPAGLAPRIEQRLEVERREQELGPPPEEESFEREVRFPPKEEMRPPEVKNAFLDAYAGIVAELKKVFDQLRAGRSVPSESVGRIVGDAMGMVRDVEAFLALAAHPRCDDPYVRHAVRVGLFSLATGLSFRWNRKRIFELAHAAFLIDAGMLRVDQGIVRKTVALTDPERAEIRRHVHYGLDMIRSIGGVPWLSAMAVYQSHERGDGSGYPEGRKLTDIILPARIIATADVYASLTEDRPHRPALLPYRAMETVVKMGGIKWLDPEVIRGLLRHLSLFPLGSWGELTTGEKVRIVSTNPDDYMRPVVSVTNNRKGEPVDPFRINLMKNPQVRIRRPLPAEGLEPDDDPLRGF